MPARSWASARRCWCWRPTVLAVLAIGRTIWHRRLLGTGGNLVGAFQTGLPVARLRDLGLHRLRCSPPPPPLCLVGETASADPLLGPSYTLSSVSAVVLGGTALSGGAGGAVGSVLGALILGTINNVIFFAGLPYEMRRACAKGVIVLLALAGGVLVARR